MDIPPIPPVREVDGPALSLSSQEAEHIRKEVGANELPTTRRAGSVRRLIRQLFNYFAILLWVAAALSFVARLPELGFAIIAVIVLNAVFSFVQESRANRAAEALKAMLPMRAHVMRDGLRTEADAAEVVPTDLLLLEPGDRICADGEVLTSDNLSLDVSMLTGESDPVHIGEGGSVYAGTFVIEGKGSARVTATGAHSQLAKISQLSSAGSGPTTPLEHELRRIVRITAVIAIAIGAVFLLVTVILGDPLSQAFLFAVGVTVALVPEALLPTVTLTLAIGAERMSKRNVLVRDLSAVQTLGSVTYICTDKTGTLTENRLTVVEMWANDAQALLRCALLACEGHIVDGGLTGDPLDVAIDVWARSRGSSYEAERTSTHIVRTNSFDASRRMMSCLSEMEVFVKGAPDAVFARCTSIEPQAHEQVLVWARKGLRVIAVAHRALTPNAQPIDRDEAERDLTLVGLLAFEDPPRDGVGESIRQCRDSGILIAMITGDHAETAKAIANEVGLREDGDPVLLGDDLPADDAALGEMLDQPGVVIARVTPEGKLRVANALRERGHVVAMTGDGVNDAPALHAANVGIAMGREGTDVAREAADIVLLDNHFSSIVDGIELGRTTYVNIRRFLTYHLSANVAELTPFVIWAVSGGSIPLALGVLQILAIDIGTDTWTATALGAEPSRRGVGTSAPVRGHILDRTVFRRAFGLLGPTIAAMSMLAFVATFWVSGWRPGEPFPTGPIVLAASGAAFFTVVTAQSANAFACRSATQLPATLGWLSNRLLPPAIAFALAFSLAILLIGNLATFFNQSAPTPIGWLIAVIAPFTLLAVDAIDKTVRSVRRKSQAG